MPDYSEYTATMPAQLTDFGNALRKCKFAEARAIGIKFQSDMIEVMEIIERTEEVSGSAST